MNYKLIAIATLVIAPILAMLASHVTQNMIPGQQPVTMAAAVAGTPPVAVTPAPAPAPAPMAPPNTGFTMPQAGMPLPGAGEPMAGADAPAGTLEVAPPPTPSAPPSGILPPYPGQYRERASDTVHLSDGRTIG